MMNARGWLRGVCGAAVLAAGVGLTLRAEGQESSAKGRAATISVDAAKTYQTIDGFGACGGMNVLWSNGPFWDDDFLKLAFDDLGLTMIRTSLPPFPDRNGGGDGAKEWNDKQVPYLKAVHAYWKANDIPGKFIASIWSPPASMKTSNSVIGGTLKTSEYENYSQYVVDWCKRFKADIGVDLYAVSPQNEPALGTGYDSCNYLPREFTPVVTNVAHALSASGVPTLMHWPDNIWWRGRWEYDIFAEVVKDPITRQVGNILSWHYGTVDEKEERRQLQELRDEALGGTTKFRMWNTEFGGYFDDWNGIRNDESNNKTGGAWEQAVTMHLNMQYDFNAIVWWQLSEPPQPNPGGRHYALLYHDASGKPQFGCRAAVFKNFSRYIRPGAVRVGCESSDANVWAVAFKHAADQTFTVVLLNYGSSAATATVSGAGLPASFDAYQTSPSQNCVNIGSFNAGQAVSLPVKSITTLYNKPAPRAGIAASPVRVAAPASTNSKGKRE
jgi:O-glycosyl hydrolase